MSNASPLKALIVVLLTALVCSTLVSAAVVVLRPIQINNQLLDRSRNIMALTGLLPAGEAVEDETMLELFRSLDTRMADIDEGNFDESIDPLTFDMRRAANDPDLSTAVPASSDLAKIGRRSRYAPVYIVWDGDEMDRLILPVRGAGMWSMLYGYIAIEPDMSTIAGMTFYEQNETPGLGDQIAGGGIGGRLRPPPTTVRAGRRRRKRRSDLRRAVEALSPALRPWSPHHR